MSTQTNRTHLWRLTLGLLLLPCTSLLAADTTPRQNSEAPFITVLQPREALTLRLGEPLTVEWHVANSPAERQDWVLRVLLKECAMGNVPLYEGPLQGEHGSHTWVIDASQNPHVGEPDLEWYVYVILFNERTGNDELLAMALGCHAVGNSEGLIIGTSTAKVTINGAPQEPEH